MTEEFELYNRVEGLAGKLIMEHRKIFKNVCANVDFYSGFVYSMCWESLRSCLHQFLPIPHVCLAGVPTDLRSL